MLTVSLASLRKAGKWLMAMLVLVVRARQQLMKPMHLCTRPVSSWSRASNYSRLRDDNTISFANRSTLAPWLYFLVCNKLKVFYIAFFCNFFVVNVSVTVFIFNILSFNNSIQFVKSDVCVFTRSDRFGLSSTISRYHVFQSTLFFMRVSKK